MGVRVDKEKALFMASLFSYMAKLMKSNGADDETVKLAVEEAKRYHGMATE